MSILGELAKLIVGTGMVKSAVDGLGNKLGAGTEIAEFNQTKKGGIKVKVKQVYSLEDRMAEITALANKGKLDPEIRRFVAECLNKKCGKEWCVAQRDYDGEIKAIFDGVQRNVRYTGDIWGVDTFQRASLTLEMGVGDCDDQSILIASCLMSVGYPVRFRVIKTTGSSDWNHIFVLCGRPPRDPKQWVSLDATVKKPAGWYPPKSMIKDVKDFVP